MKKMPFPDHLLVVPAEIKLNAEGLSEDGAPVPAVSWSGKVWYSEKSRTVKDKDGRDVTLEGSVIAKGDIAPALPVVTDGTVLVAGRTYEIYRVERPRNPDGSVHHTTVRLL